MSYLVSVGIATRNREFYAKKVVEQICKIGKDIEVCLSDNSSSRTLDNELYDLIKSGQVKYKYCPERIAVVANYNNTALMATGEYFICLGDDDVLLPTIHKVVHWMKENDLDAVRTSRQLSYMWPLNNSNDGVMHVGFFTDDSHSFDPFQSVVTLLMNGCQGYQYSDMAGSYHALVKMNRMREVEKLTGYFFNGFSPDIYNAVCLSLLPQMRCAYFDFPISIPGFCSQSATYRAKKRKAVSTVEEAINNYSNSDYHWDHLIPYYYTPETTWAETTIKAVKMMGRQDLIEQYFNQEILVNIIYNRWVEYRTEIIGKLDQGKKNLIHENRTYSNPNILKLNRNFFDKILSRLNGDVKIYHHVEDNNQAVEVFGRYINKKRQNKKWKKLIESRINA